MIRKYQDSDVDAVVSVWRVASDLAHPFLTKEFQDDAAVKVRNVYLQFAETWVKEVDDEVIGFIALIENEVGALFISPMHHGKGMGRELMDFAVRQKGSVTVEVFKENPIGRKFYDRYGFRIIEEVLHEPSGHMAIKMGFDPERI